MSILRDYWVTHAGGLSLSRDKLYTHDGACPSSTCPNLSHKVRSTRYMAVNNFACESGVVRFVG